ncbi:ROK family protein [Maricaulaceae bacterium MS644]
MHRIGVDLGGTKIEAAMLGPRGEWVARKRAPSPPGYDAKIRAVRALVEAVEAETGISAPHAGVGHPGSLNPRTGLMRNANSTELNGRPLDKDLCDALARPVACANDANCFALSEAVDGAGAEAASVFGVIVGTGVGGGVVIDGRLVTGHDGNAGEWGHIPLARPTASETPGPACKCGLHGCVEAWCSGPALSADHERRTGERRTVEEIAGAAAGGDLMARETLAYHLDRLARSLASVINILDPQLVVLGGGVSNLKNLAPDLEAAMAPFLFTDEPRTRVRRNVHGDSSGVRGAAWLDPHPRAQR